MFIDTHCHLDFFAFDDDREDVITRAVSAGVMRMIVPGIDLENNPNIIELTKRYDPVFSSVGVHPNSSAEWNDSWKNAIRKQAIHEKVVAIGEIGLDYYRDYSPKDIQKCALISQLELAIELALPIIVHNREADGDLLAIFDKSKIYEREKVGVLHSFSSSWETASVALEMGFFLGFTGPVTYKKSDMIRDVISKMPLEKIIVETDSPFLTPQKYRGKRNEPAYVTEVAEKIAEIRGLSVTEIARITTENASNLFGTKLIE